VRYPVKIIYRAVERIDHPLVIAGLITYDSFLSIECVIRELREQQIGNQRLRFDVDRQFDIVGFGDVYLARQTKAPTQKFARSAGRVLCGIQVMSHSRNDNRKAATSNVERSAMPPSFAYKKTGRKNKFSSRVEFGFKSRDRGTVISERR
jgi:hypothetical protein